MQHTILAQPSMKSIFLRIIKEFTPIALADLGVDSGNTFNAFLLSHLDPTENYSAAANIISTTQLVIVIIPSAFLYVIMPTMEFRMPQNKKSVVTASMLFAILLSLPGAIASSFMGDFFSALGVNDEVCNIVDEYFSVFSFALPFWMIATALNKTAVPLNHLSLMYIESFANFTFMMGFSGVFVKLYPLPNISPVKTIALSYLFCSIARILLYISTYWYYDKLEKWNEINIDLYVQAIRHVFNMGWKLCAQLSSELIAIYFLSILTSVFLLNKTMNLNVLNVMCQSFEFSIIITLSMAITAHNMVNRLINDKSNDLIPTYVNAFLIMSTVYNSILFIIAQAAPNAIIRLFMNPEDNTNSGLSGNFRALFTITFFSLVFNAYKDIINMAGRSLGLFGLPMKASLLGIWAIGIPLAILFAASTQLGVGGILLGSCIGNIITSVFLLAHWQLVSQPKAVKDCLDEPNRFDSVAYCFSEYKSMFFKIGRTGQEDLKENLLTTLPKP